jgi:hypothetical protein
MKQNVTRVDLVDHMAGLIHDLDGAVQAAAPLAEQSKAGGDGFVPRRLDIRQILAVSVAGEGVTLADMEIIVGHQVGFAMLLIR